MLKWRQAALGSVGDLNRTPRPLGERAGGVISICTVPRPPFNRTPAMVYVAFGRFCCYNGGMEPINDAPEPDKPLVDQPVEAPKPPSKQYRGGGKRGRKAPS